MSAYSDLVAGIAAAVKLTEIMTADSASDVDLTSIGGGVVPSMAKALARPDLWQGTWNATTNAPALASGVGTAGFSYTVATAGATSLDGHNQWNVGDVAIFHGGHWYKVGRDVLSVSGHIGAVTAAQLVNDIFLEGNLPETTVNSDATLDLTAVTTPRVLVNCITSTITAIDAPANSCMVLRFSGALQLAHNSPSLVLQGGKSITTAAGDTAALVTDASGNVTLLPYTRAAARPDRVQQPGRSFTANSSPVTLTLGYNGITNATGGVLVCNLPASPADTDVVIAKDEVGSADANEFRVTPRSGTIEGAAYQAIDTKYGWRKLRWSAALGAWVQVP